MEALPLPRPGWRGALILGRMLGERRRLHLSVVIQAWAPPPGRCCPFSEILSHRGTLPTEAFSDPPLHPSCLHGWGWGRMQNTLEHSGIFLAQ